MRARYGALGGLILMLAGAAAPGQGTDGKVALKTVSYAELGKMVRDLKGKVVVVDFWAEY
jgi:hypothetical protein